MRQVDKNNLKKRLCFIWTIQNTMEKTWRLICTVNNVSKHSLSLTTVNMPEERRLLRNPPLPVSSWVLYEKPNFKGAKIALDEGDLELTCPFGPAELQQNGHADEPEPERKFVIGSIRRAVRVRRPQLGFPLKVSPAPTFLGVFLAGGETRRDLKDSMDVEALLVCSD